ncbi:hypothetical protein GW17_00009526 [Ensete ventricosum]|nr:hypothetical protein GW17_00009526 [Ensete ventricosum]RZR92233.1 hypothetical protein BHM03_00020485 [Ensete ventricosum]
MGLLSLVLHDSFLAPSPSPAQAGGTVTNPRSSAPGTFALPGISPASGPAGSTSEASIVILPCLGPLASLYDVYKLSKT